MILISHRGNLNGSIKSMENNPLYIDIALNKGFQVEIDVWYKTNRLYLGHDFPEYEIDFLWLKSRMKSLWIHCKNIDAIVFFNNAAERFNYFWHETDTITLTSLNYIWAYPGKQPIKQSIAVMPEINNDQLIDCIGICSDKIIFYNDKNNNI
jgi:hypothetical protein